MTTVLDLQELEEIRALVEKGRHEGILSYAEVTSAVADLELDEAELDELHHYFEGHEIELVEDIEHVAAPEVEQEERRGRRRKSAVDLRPDITTDSLQVFLKDIGR